MNSTGKNIDNIAILLECTLINAENPSYIEISYQGNCFYILLSKPDYKHYSLAERIHSIFDLLQFEHSDILEQYSIVVECLDEVELQELFKFHGK